MCDPGQHGAPAAPSRPAAGMSSTGQALAALRGALGYLASADPTALTAAERAECLRGLAVPPGVAGRPQ